MTTISSDVSNDLARMAMELHLSVKDIFVKGKPSFMDLFDFILRDLAQGGEIVSYTKGNSTSRILLF